MQDRKGAAGTVEEVELLIEKYAKKLRVDIERRFIGENFTDEVNALANLIYANTGIKISCNIGASQDIDYETVTQNISNSLKNIKLNSREFTRAVRTTTHDTDSIETS